MNKRKFLRILTVFFLFLAVLGAGVLAYASHQFGKIRHVEPGEEPRIERAEESFEEDFPSEDGSANEQASAMIPDGYIAMEEAEILWEGADPDVMDDKDIANILLIGQDRREGEGRQRSDSIILFTINKKTSELSLTSFMRDLYVQIPGYSDNRINAAYAFGGMSLLDEALEQNFGIQVDGNIEVDFSGFVSCIDALGGIDIELNQEEADYLKDTALTAGMNHLDGTQALAYSRIRYVGNSDYERTERQRRVLTAAFEKMKQSDPATIIQTVSAVFPYLSTDMNMGEILGYALTVFNLGPQTLNSYRIPVDGGYQPAVIRRMMVLVPDLGRNQSYLREVLYGEI